MLHDSVFVDMTVFALQLKEKSTACVSDEILRNFRTATFEVNFEGYFWKENRRGEGRAVSLVISGFHYFIGQLFIKENKLWTNLHSPQIFT